MMTKQAILGTLVALVALPGVTALAVPPHEIHVDTGGALQLIDGVGAGSLIGAAGTVLGAVAGAGTDSCSGDPCASATCVPGSAQAAAGGSELATADAAVGTDKSHQSQPGGAAAKAQGTGAVSASSKGERAWSWKEANASCSRGATATSASAGLSTGCVADEAVQETRSFSGKLFGDAAGGLLAVDETTGLGLALPADFVLRGDTLQALAPVDLAGLTPLGSVLSLGLVSGEDMVGCSVDLA